MALWGAIIGSLGYTVLCVHQDVRTHWGKHAKAADTDAATGAPSKSLSQPALDGNSVAGTTDASRVQAPAVPAGRQNLWDLMKCVMMFYVILLHVGRTFVDGGLSPKQHALFAPLGPFTMPVFTFISGVFGTSVEFQSNLKMLCSTIGAFALGVLLHGFVMVLTAGPWDLKDLVLSSDFVLWYLWSLTLWRLTITPLFHLARKANLPAVAPFLVVLLTSYLLQHVGPRPRLRAPIYFAPFFALGLVLPPAQWARVLMDRRAVALAVAVSATWCFGLAFSPRFQTWNDAACWQGVAQCPDFHWPKTVSWEPGLKGVSQATFLALLRALSLQSAISFGAMGLIGAAERPLREASPGLADWLQACGSRTLFAYVLHFVFLVRLGARVGFSLPQGPLMGTYFLCSLVAVQQMLAWCSGLTEMLFAWAIRPFWLLPLCGGRAGK